MQNKVIVITPEELNEILQTKFEYFTDQLIERLEAERKKDVKIYTLNKAAAILQVSYTKIKSLTDSGKIKTTADNRILSTEIDNYLNNPDNENN
ncbi:MAG: hypothetical protein JXR68_06750 [Bacteroidales bacterium]|nr:hypothetical protein [Bacteroidales bacterium]